MFDMVIDSNKLCSNILQLFTDYNHIHLETFKKTVKEVRGIIDSKSIYESWLHNLDRTYEKELKSKRFTSILSNYVDSLIDFRQSCRTFGIPVNEIDQFAYDIRKQMLDFPTATEIETDPNSSPSEIIYSKNKIELIHYLNPKPNSIPVILVYAQINRFNIMDLMPEKSVVQNLMSQGFDVFVIHWGYSGTNDDPMTVDDYIRCLDESVKIIQEKTDSKKISMIGYCWGGILSLIYSALFKDKIKNLAILATPIDFSKDTSHLSLWAKEIDADKMMDEFGHLNPLFLNIGFFMRNPSRNFDKYFKMLSRINDKPFLDNFFAMEKWLHNTPPIPGQYFRQIINDGYKNNSLIKNQMRVLDKTIDLKKIDFPVLTVVAKKDDLVSPSSTLELEQYISSDEKTTMTYDGGHVGLCISTHAQKTLWPKIAQWLHEKSKTETVSKKPKSSKTEITLTA